VLARSRAYLDVGCDAIFPEALLAPEEFRRARRAARPAGAAGRRGAAAGARRRDRRAARRL